MDNQFKEFLKERNAALTTLDMDFARKVMPGLSDEVLLIGMHKARYQCLDIAKELRHTSAAFLRDGGHKVDGKDILSEGYLPE